MKTKVDLPKAFSVRGVNEILPVRHLIERMNPQLRLAQVATGKHVHGGETVVWRFVYPEGASQ